MERIHDALTNHLEDDRARRAVEEATRVTPFDEEFPADDIEPVEQSNATETVTAPVKLEQVPDPITDLLETREEPLVAGVNRPEHVSIGAVATEEVGDLTPDPERFYDVAYIPRLERLIEDIVKNEGPLPVTLLSRRVAQKHGWQRTGRRIVEQVRAPWRASMSTMRTASILPGARAVTQTVYRSKLTWIAASAKSRALKLRGFMTPMHRRSNEATTPLATYHGWQACNV